MSDLLTPEERAVVESKCRHRPWDSWLDPYLEAQDAKTRKAVADSIKRELEKAIADEPEFPSEMPDEMFEAIKEAVRDRGDRSVITDIMRNTVRITKRGIAERFLIALANLTGGSGD